MNGNGEPAVEEKVDSKSWAEASCERGTSEEAELSSERPLSAETVSSKSASLRGPII